MSENYVVYWYRLPEHSNPYCQGYIGITNNFDRRHKEHSNAARNLDKGHFYNAIRKYGEDVIIHQILHECTKEEALDLEYSYRPDTNIGWNAAVGGEDTLKSVMSVPITLYHKDSPTNLLHFSSITEASDVLNLTRGRISQAHCRGRSIYGYDGWAILFDPSYDVTQTLTIGEHRSLTLKGKPKSKPSHFKGMTNRWSEEDKQRISRQHKGKTISLEQRKIMSEKNRLNPSLCKYIELVHESDPSTVHSFHSISEASRQLDLPLPRLKSKAQRPLNRFGKDGWAITKLGSD